MASVSGLIDDKPVRIHLDSCSETNCISEAMFATLPSAKALPFLQGLQSADGTPLRSHGLTMVTVDLDGHSWTETFVITSDLGVDVLIGHPSMVKQRLDIINSEAVARITDLSGRVLTELPLSVPTTSAHETDHVMAVKRIPKKLKGIIYADIDVVIPPHTELVLPVKVPKKSKASRDSYCFLLDSLSRDNTHIFVAKGIQTFTNGFGEVVVCNPTSKPRHVGRGTRVGRFKVVDPDDFWLLPMDGPLDERRSVLMLAKQVLEDLDLNSEEFKDFPPELNIQDADATLNDDELMQLMRLLNRYKHLFTPSKDAKATHVDRSIAEHTIDLLPGTQPIAMAPYRTSPENRRVIREQIIEMLSKGVIRESRSPWASPVVLAPKKDGEKRFCIDYRRLNNVTKREMYALPRIDDTLDALGGAKYFTCLDLTWGYWQIKMRLEDIEKTAFVTHEGQYEWVHMPFGLTNAPATFQRMMNSAFAGLTWQCCLVYLDDIIIYSKTFEDHLKDLASVFARIDEYGLRCKPSKCHIACNKVQYLGHMLTPDGLRAAPGKIKAIVDWPVPRNVKEVQSFLGLCGYYRKLIKDFAQIEKPLRDLTLKDRIFYVGPLELTAFNKLKDRLASDPVLKLPDFSGKYPFEVHTDACDIGVGSVLVQHDDKQLERAVAYASKNFNPTQLKWHTQEQEAYAIVWSLEQFRPYLLGSHFVVKTDHQSLQWLAKATKGRIARWSMALNEFDFTIKYRKGKANANADAMSRISWPDGRSSDDDDVYARMTELSDADAFLASAKEAESADPAVVQIITMEPLLSSFRIHAVSVDSTLSDRVRSAQHSNTAMVRALELVAAGNHDEALAALMDAPAQERVFFRTPRAAKLDVVDGVLCLSRDKRTQVLIPHNSLDLKRELLEKTHDHLMAGHLGAHKTTHRLLQHYFWPNINTEVKKYVKGCLQCQARKTPAPIKRSLTPSVVSKINGLLGVDLIGPLSSPDGTRYTYVLVMIDYFSKYANAVPLDNKEAITVAEGIFNGWYLQYGLPDAIHTDQGSEFTNDVLRRLNLRAGVDAEFTTPYNPSSNGEVERVNRTLVDCLSCYVEDNPGLWHKHLQGVLFAYRTAPHSVTGYTPFFLMHGREARSPIDILASSLKEIYHDVASYGTLVTRELKHAYDIVRTRLLENAKRTLSKWNASHPRKVATFQPGDQVLMFKPNLNKQTGQPDHSAKFNKSWNGPYVVREHRFDADSDVYLLEDTSTGRQWSVNVNKLTQYFPRTFLDRKATTAQAAAADGSERVDGGHGGAEPVECVEPMREEVVAPNLGGPSSAEALASLETAIPTVQSPTQTVFGVTRSTPTLPVSHADTAAPKRPGRTRTTRQELAREAKRLKLADDDVCDYAARLESFEFKKILDHGKAGNRYYYVVDWVDPGYEPSRVWCNDVDTRDAVEDYWKSIPKGSRPRMFRRYPFAASTEVGTGRPE